VTWLTCIRKVSAGYWLPKRKLLYNTKLISRWDSERKHF